MAIHKALRRWTTVESRVVQIRNNYNDGREFDHDLLWAADREASIEALREAHVVHNHNYQMIPEVEKLVRKKPMLVQYHSVPPVPRKYPNALQAVIAQPLQVASHPDCVLLPNIIPLQDELYKPTWDEEPEPHDVLHVAFAPTNRSGGNGMSVKGYEATVGTLKRLAERGYLTYDVIEKVALRACLKRKQAAHVAIDEVVTGNFHRSSLESLAQGSIAIANIGPQARAFFKRFFGGEMLHPWMSATLETLEVTLERLARDQALVCMGRLRARQFMENYWNDEEMIKRYVGVYQQLVYDGGEGPEDSRP
jgi:hypothetical protein